jgi:hypothetical protein
MFFQLGAQTPLRHQLLVPFFPLYNITTAQPKKKKKKIKLSPFQLKRKLPRIQPPKTIESLLPTSSTSVKRE